MGSADPWVVPFVVQLVGEYVLEILVVIRDELRDAWVGDTRPAADALHGWAHPLGPHRRTRFQVEDLLGRRVTR
ncbi:hypothetical protein Psi01_64800 [Planobispora siamensis]|uniref:Uncharacterized protein n=1 Tax=Planobispora siamensis TaxID=936338 RepID=A0A8J3SMC4_9ACTN|nr:hypothetical protein Psi01_64800 [Planobispora siamensis]